MPLLRTIVTVLLVLGSAISVAAQGHSPAEPPLASRSIVTAVVAPSAESAVQIWNTLERWTNDYDEWKAWFAQWRNRREPGWWSSRDRRVAPVPPEWLRAACVNAADEDGVLREACRALRDSQRDLADEAAAVAAQQTAQVRSRLESPQKSSWWSRVHLDALWPMTRSGSAAFGVAGMHVTIPVGGRFQVFAAPGAILMRLPSIDGSPVLTAATDWGFSFRVTDFRLPGVRRANTLHFNMARVWLLDKPSTLQAPGDLYVAGFSLTFKQR
jgi:hypothetical protein